MQELKVYLRFYAVFILTGIFAQQFTVQQFFNCCIFLINRMVQQQKGLHALCPDKF